LSKKYSVRPEDTASPTVPTDTVAEDNRSEEINDDHNNEDGLLEYDDLRSDESEHEDLAE
jgi:hypothetical protein